MNFTHNINREIPEYINRTEREFHEQSIRSGMMSLTRPLNTPAFMDDPYIRQQRWGNNIRIPTKFGVIPNGTPLEVENNLLRRDVHLTKYCSPREYPQTRISTMAGAVSRTVQSPITNQSRSSHPAWMYRDVEQTRWEYPLLNPQENTCMRFSNNLSSRILAKNKW